MDKELLPNFSVSGTFTYRRMVDLIWDPLTGVKPSDYTQTGTLTGTIAELGAYSVPLYGLKVGGGAGRRRRDRDQPRRATTSAISGFEFSATKRMSNHWMARFGFSTNDWREYFDDPSLSIVDPTKAPAPAITQARQFAGPADRRRAGRAASRQAAARATSTWSRRSTRSSPTGRTRDRGASTSAPTSSRARATPSRSSSSNVATGDPLGRKKVLLVNQVRPFRLPAVTSLDGRVEKRFTFGSTHASRSTSTSSTC